MTTLLVLDIRVVAALSVALFVLASLGILFYRRPMLLVCSWPVVLLVEIPFPDLALQAGPFLLLPMDSVYYFTVIHLCACLLFHPRKLAAVLKENRWLAVFLGLVAAHIVLYTPVYGQSAIGEARKLYAMFLFPILALLTIQRPADLQRLVLVIVMAAACISAAALVQGVFRSISASGTLIVALAAFSMALHRMYGIVVVNPLMDRLLLLLFSGVVVGAGHRTVWITVGFGLLVAVWLYRMRPTIVAKTIIMVMFIVAALTVGIAIFPQTGSRLMKGFAGVLDPSSDGTASWRMEAWRQQLGALTTGEVLLGKGLGGYYLWQFEGRNVRVSPHNAYVQMVLKLGLLGLVLYGFLAFQFLRRALAVRKKLRPGPLKASIEIGILNVGAAQAYMLGYGIEPIMLIFFAVAASAARLGENPLRLLRPRQTFAWTRPYSAQSAMLSS